MEKNDHSMKGECFTDDMASAIVSGKLNPEEKEQVLSHITSCRTCSLRVKAERALEDFVRTETKPKDYISPLERKLLEEIRLVSVPIKENLESLNAFVSYFFKSLYDKMQSMVAFPEELHLISIPVLAAGRVLGISGKENKQEQKPPLWDQVFEGKQAIQIKYGDETIQAVSLPDEKEWVLTAFHKNVKYHLNYILVEWKEDSQIKRKKYQADEYGQVILNEGDFSFLCRPPETILTFACTIEDVTPESASNNSLGN